MVQCLGAFTAEGPARVQSLVGGLRFHKPRIVEKKKKVVQCSAQGFIGEQRRQRRWFPAPIGPSIYWQIITTAIMTIIDSKQKCYLCWLFFLCSTSTCWDFSGLQRGFSCLLHPLSPKGKVVALNNELHMTYRQFRPLFWFQINIPKCLFFISTSTFHRHFTFGAIWYWI